MPRRIAPQNASERVALRQAFALLKATKKPAECGGLFLIGFGVLGVRGFEPRLTLRELGSAACTTQTVLLSFLHTRIACEESVVTERWEILFAETDEGSSYTHANRAGLAHRTTPGHSNEHVHRVALPNVIEGLNNQSSLSIGYEILFELAIIDRDFSSTWPDSHPSDAGFTTPRSEAVTVNISLGLDIGSMDGFS